ncbi:MAG: hypothetical protein E5Y15_32410 [Mesorhizobium sp.]|nr:MAG: hypothetical protein E5Y15_32410 [Mesorhizobium sp.]
MRGRCPAGQRGVLSLNLSTNHSLSAGWEWLKSEVGDPSHPPLSCRTSPPQGGRLYGASAFANYKRWPGGSFMAALSLSRKTPPPHCACRA